MKFLSKIIPEAIQIEDPRCISRFILAAGDHRVRYQGASGGVVSAVIRYLFSAGIVQTAINFRFDKAELFSPYLIYSYDEYQQTGSIYHDIQMLEFLRQNKAAIKGTIVVVCLPCQVAAVRQILNSNNISHFIVSLFCSGQQKKEATWFYLKNNGVNPDNIESLSYRGEGWPSGIKIKLQDGKEVYDANVGGSWGKYRIPPFSLKRCLFCKDTFGINADISVGDPWLKKYMNTETVGLSLVGTLTTKGDEIINEMIQSGSLLLVENVDDIVFVVHSKLLSLENI
jgi:coenzyme F420-reducing hydrogenase beta subunit